MLATLASQIPILAPALPPLGLGFFDLTPFDQKTGHPSLRVYQDPQKLILSGQKSFSQAKKFIFAWEKDRKWLQAVEKFFSMAKKLFSIHFTSKNVLFSLGQKFLSGTKMFCLGQKLFCSVQKIFCPGRWTGHKNTKRTVQGGDKVPVRKTEAALRLLLRLEGDS